MKRSFIDLIRGITHHPWSTIRHGFTCFSVLFTLVKAVTQFIPTVRIEGILPLSAAILISCCYALQKVWKPSRVEICVRNCNTVIEVMFGDLFQQDGLRIIPVNEFFDSKLGRPVSDRSVHGILLRQCFGGHPESFDRQLDSELQDVPSECVEKVDGKRQKYAIGTTAVVTSNDERYVLFPFARSESATCKASSDVRLMWTSLSSLWQRIRIEAGGYPANIPLVGSGLSGLGLPTRDLLNLIILSIITETKAREITQRIRIVLHPDRFEHVDLRDVKKHWEE